MAPGGSSELQRYFIEQNMQTQAKAIDREFGEELSKNSEVAKSIRKHTTPKVTNPNDVWKIKYQNNRGLVTFLILSYCLSQDDGQITKKEFKIFDKLMRTEGMYFMQEQLEIVLKFTGDLPNNRYVLNYLQDKGIKEKMFNESITIVRKSLKDKKHIELLNRIQLDYKTI